jgi:DNA invertase Pin-like site-specific DNA recombinase
MEEKKRAWTYCRIDAPEDQHGCLKGQRKELLDYAEQMGFEVVGESQDTGSGLNFDRNGLTEVMEAASEGKMDVLLVVNVSCLGRDTARTMDFIRGLDQLGIELYSPLEGEIRYTEYENLYHGIAAMKFE